MENALFNIKCKHCQQIMTFQQNGLFCNYCQRFVIIDDLELDG